MGHWSGSFTWGQAGGRLWACIVLLLGCALCQNTSEGQQRIVRVRTGQELANAVAEWGASGSNMLVLIDVPYLTLHNTTFTNYSTMAATTGRLPFSSGRLIINGQGSVLDAGMRDSLVPELVAGQLAHYEVQNMRIVNLCEGTFYKLPFNTPAAVNPFQLLLFRTSWIYQARVLSNLVMYGRHAAVSGLAYQFALLRTRIPEVRDQVASFLETSGVSISPGDEFTPYSISARTVIESATLYQNMTLRALNTPGDPLISKLAADNLLMGPQICGGDLLPAVFSEARYDPLLAPIWIAMSQGSFETSLEEASAQTKTPSILGMPVILGLAKGRYEAPTKRSYELTSALLIANGVPEDTPFDQLPAIDLNQRIALFNIATKGKLLMEMTTLTGLIATVPTKLPRSLTGTLTTSLLPSVFPLAAFNTSNGPDTWAISSQVVMHNVSVTVPAADYLALMLLTSDQTGLGLSAGCLDASVVQLAAQLKAGISSLLASPAAQVVEVNSSLRIDAWVGWGLNATLLRLVPAGPVRLPSCTSTSTASQPPLNLTVGLAAGLGGAALIAIAAVLWHRQQCCTDGTSSILSMKHPSILQSQPGSEGQGSVLTGSSTLEPLSVAELKSAEDGMPNASRQSLSSVVHQAARQQELVLQSAMNETAPASAQPDIADSQLLTKAKVLQQGKSNRPHQLLSVIMTPEAMRTQIQELAKTLHHGDSDKLTLAGVLGEGSGGTVYMGLWRGLPVAVKTTIFVERHADASTNNTSGIVEHRAVMEAAIAASVGHKNLVATYHYDIKPLSDRKTAGGLQIDMASGSKHTEHNTYKLFLVQELCNISLADAISSGLILHANTRQLDRVALYELLVDIARGLEYLHSKGIIHGDMKPENVLLKVADKSPEDVVAKLTDFGLSTRLDPGATHVSGYSSGTPFYVAPEVAYAHQVSPASDMFGFGVIMWEVHAQQPPCIPTPDNRFVVNPLFPDFPRRLTPTPDYQQLCRRCLHPTPQQRPTAKEVAQVLATQLQAIKRVVD